MLNDQIRARIIALRKQKGLTQQQLAESLSMDLRTYKRVESGEKKVIDVHLLESIAAVLHEPLAAFFSPPASSR